MQNLLRKYKNHGSFELLKDEKLSKCCNAPSDSVGVYLVYLNFIDYEELVYVGISGKILQSGALKLRKGGIRGRLLSGHHYKIKKSRSNQWPSLFKDGKLKSIIVKWYVTFDDENNHIPAFVEGKLLQEYFNVNKKLPKWNSVL